MLNYDDKELELLRALRKYLFDKHKANYYFVPTGHTYAALDGIAVKQIGDKAFEIAAVYESKCRHTTLHKLSTYNPPNALMVTYDKLLAGVSVSKELMVPFYCLTYFLDENPTKGMFLEVTDEKGNIVVDIHITRESNPRSKANPNTKVVRTNAYLSIESGELFNVEPKND